METKGIHFLIKAIYDLFCRHANVKCWNLKPSDSSNKQSNLKQIYISGECFVQSRHMERDASAKNHLWSQSGSTMRRLMEIPGLV